MEGYIPNRNQIALIIEQMTELATDCVYLSISVTDKFACGSIALKDETIRFHKHLDGEVERSE